MEEKQRSHLMCGTDESLRFWDWAGQAVALSSPAFEHRRGAVRDGANADCPKSHAARVSEVLRGDSIDPEIVHPMGN